jgi:hypothetical protein
MTPSRRPTAVELRQGTSSGREGPYVVLPVRAGCFGGRQARREACYRSATSPNLAGKGEGEFAIVDTAR